MKTYKNLQDFLEEHRIKGTIIEKPNTQATLDACTALKEQGINVEPTDMIKAILIIGKDQMGQSKNVLAMVRGIDKINTEAIQNKLNFKKIRIPTPDQALEICSYQRGGTPPIGIEGLYAVVADTKLMQPTRTIVGGGGDPEHVLAIDSFELQKKIKELGTKLLITTIGQTIQ